jgi:hypothetical protein
MKRITRRKLVETAEDLVRLASQYGQHEYHREMRLDAMLLGYMEAKYGEIRRQHQIEMGGTTRPKRIDFRQGGSRPVLIEFAVRTPGKNQIYGSQNRSELHKLERQKNSKASARYLLLLDLSGKSAIGRAELQDTYDEQPSGRGKYSRHPVWVMYAHPEESYVFKWHPR